VQFIIFSSLLTKSSDDDGMVTRAPISHHLDLYAYWLAKRGSRTMPARRDFDPGDIPALLPYLMIVGKAGAQLRYRLVGTAVVHMIGHDATGTAVGSYLAAPAQAAEARAVFERVFTGAKPVFATGEFILKSGASLALSLLALPLSSNGTIVSMTISTLISRFNNRHTASRGWLKGLPVKVWDVADVSSAADLKALCLDWEQHCQP
jgi:hypothetical protein